MVFCFKIFWYLLGLTREDERSFIWLEELDGKALVKHLEYGFAMFDVDYLVRAE